MPGRLPPRFAQVLQLGTITVANVHLSHGQLLNRWQLLRIIRTLEGPAAVIGDYNAVGPTPLPGFKDVGPRKATLVAQNVLRFRLDRCLIRGIDCAEARILERGPSDHRPIAIELSAAEQQSGKIGKKRRRTKDSCESKFWRPTTFGKSRIELNTSGRLRITARPSI